MTTREEIIAAAQRYWRRDTWNNEYFDAAGYADFVLASRDAEIQRLQMALADAEALELGTAEKCNQLRTELVKALAACKAKDEALRAANHSCIEDWPLLREALAIQPDDSALKAWLGERDAIPEDVRKDAERYRWLRESGSNWIKCDVDTEISMSQPDNWDWPTTIDTVIDAAIAAAPKGEE